MYKIGGAHLQCENNHYAKFEYKGMKTVGSYRLHKLGTPSVVDGQMDRVDPLLDLHFAKAMQVIIVWNQLEMDQQFMRKNCFMLLLQPFCTLKQTVNP